MTAEKLVEILEKHKRWLNDEEGGERADLFNADLNHANLRYADLSSANLYGADLRSVDLSSAEGLISAADYMDAHFERIDEGYIAYKTFNCTYDAPTDWRIEAGAVLNENVNFNRTNLCGCGINVAPLKWVKHAYPNKPIWKVLIRWEWLAGICVPYNTDGKIRCERVELLEVVK